MLTKSFILKSAIVFVLFGNFKKFFYYSFYWTQVKRSLISSIRNFIYKSSHDLPSNSRLTILEKNEILGRSENCIRTLSCALPTLQSLFNLTLPDLLILVKILSTGCSPKYMFCASFPVCFSYSRFLFRHSYIIISHYY